jgi:methylenetetrahydrofolate dehydrogenase (NADP+)/methenyltetrahydrofolate cyclohydrolase
MELLKGADVAAYMTRQMKEELAAKGEPSPHLMIMRVGARPDDLSYERGAKKRLDNIGIRCSVSEFPESISNEAFLANLQCANADPDIDGILIFTPFPEQIDREAVAAAIAPEKDVDGISPVNMAKIYAGDGTGFAPCTAEAVVEMLHYAQIPLSGKRAVIVGRSLVVGRPLSLLLLKENCTVTICHTRTANLERTCQDAEILVACAGQARMLNQSHVGLGAVVVDVGIHMDEQNRLCGDVDFDSVKDLASVITPVPGGVGAVTTSVLAKHVLLAAKRRRS